MSKNLPVGWAETELGDCLLSIMGGGTPSRNVAAYFEGAIPWFTVKDMKSPKPSDAKEHISEEAVANSATNVVPPNTLICATRIALGRAIRPTVECAINQDLKALIVGDGVDSDFLLYWILANEQVIQREGTGTTVSGIRLETLRSLPLLLPPSLEQIRIVEKLEELLSDLDAGMAELKAARRKLAQYRQSLLKAAVEGSLTADWRAANHRPQQPGAELLRRILSERRVSWEKNCLARFKEQNKVLPNDWQDKYSDPITPHLTELHPLPDDWVWASIDQLSPASLANGRSVPTADNGAKVLRLTAVRNGRIDLSQWKYGAWSKDEAKPFAVAEGDLLIVRGNGSLTLIGRAGLVGHVHDQIAYPDTLIRLRVTKTVVRPAWIAFIWNSERSRNHIEQRARTSAGIYKISQPDILSVMVPVPPLAEQDQILSDLADCDARLELIEAALQAASTNSAAHRRSLLKAAFSGQLVPQDPNEEPASELLARIRAARDTKASGSVAAKRGRKSKVTP